MIARKLSYGLGGFGVAIIYGLLAQLIFYFYTDVYGLTPAQAGIVAFVGAMTDAVIDPLIAWVASQTNTRFGRYRPYLMFGAPTVSVAFVMLFVVPGGGINLLLYALLAQSLFRAFYQAIYLPYTALVGQLSTRTEDRGSFASYKAWFITLGQLAVAWFGINLISAAGGSDPRRGFLVCAAVIALVSGASIFQCGLFAREVETAGPAPVADVAHPLKALRELLANGHAVQVALASFLFGVGMTVLTGGLIYVFQYDLGRRDDFRLALGTIYAVGLVTTPIWNGLSRRHGKRLAWVAGSLLAGTALSAAALLHPASTGGFLALFAVYGAGLQAVMVVMFASMADAVDYGEYRSGQRVEALAFGIMTFLNKAALACAGGLLGVILSVAGFRPGAVQDADTLTAIRLMLFLIPAALWFLTGGLMAFYSLSNERHRTAREALETRAGRWREGPSPQNTTIIREDDECRGYS